MKTVTLKRADILKAIRNEPLKPGNWAHTTKNKKGQCHVCAVGAVLRTSLKLKDDKICVIGDSICDGFGYCGSGDNVDFALEQGEYLSALSAKFETLCEKRGRQNGLETEVHPNTMRAIRRELISFVKAKLPKEFKVTV